MTDLFRRANITKDLRTERSKGVLANRCNIYLDARNADILLGEPGKSREIKILTILKWNEVVVLEMRAKFFRVERLGQLKSPELRNNSAVDNLNNVWLV